MSKTIHEKRRERNERARRYRDKVNPNRQRKRRGDTILGEIGIICYRCGRDLPFDDFRVAVRNATGRDTTCIECTKLRRYGINAVEYWEMYSTRNGRCEICLEPHDLLDVDHCHETGAIRGLLCGRCNRGLGFFSDSIEGLERAIKYLRGATS